ncbi:MAG: hypothetical protein M3Q03_20830 [Chloroflexota bacterium]|nr:hypothetical protein [Chloroflexota bacterium]
MNRRRRDRDDMLRLGGWLFADLLLGLAMLFFAANTIGSPPPTPTPTATPNLLATATAELNALATRSNQEAAAAAASATEAAVRAAETASALSSEVAFEQAAAQQTAISQATAEALRQQAATATADALATRAALTAEQRATVDAQATQDALAAEATIAAFATQQAASAQNIDTMTREQATAAAQATADAVAARATIDALATQGALVASIATENALSGANVLATANAQATQVAEIAAVATQNAQTGANALATEQARLQIVQSAVSALQTQEAVARQTAAVLATAAVGNSLNLNFVQEVIQVDRVGVVNGDPAARDAARAELGRVLDKYREECRVGFALTSGYAPGIGEGNQFADAINEILREDFPDLFGDAAFESVAFVDEPDGQVEIRLFLFSGCPVGAPPPTEPAP